MWGSNTSEQPSQSKHDVQLNNYRPRSLDHFRFGGALSIMDLDFFNVETGNDEHGKLAAAARDRLEELINKARALEAQAERKPKKVATFDPAALNVAKRSELRANMKPHEETEDRTLFKALPLPGNTPVKNNPFATTKAFEQKISSVDRLIRTDKLDDDDASALTSITSTKDRSFSSENEANKAIRAKKNLQKRHLLDEVNKILVRCGSLSDETSVIQGDGDRVEDPSLLMQHVAQLESKLKHEKTQRLATLNDIVDIDLNAIFDTLFAKDDGEDTKKIVDHLKNKIYENVLDFQSYSIGSQADAKVFVDSNYPTLFIRQDEWLKRRDKKRFEARMQIEADTMRDITGKPDLGDATRSWDMAKEAHEEALKRAQQIGERHKCFSKDNEKNKSRQLKVINWEKAKESHDEALKRATQQEEMKRKAREEKENGLKMEEAQELLATADAIVTVESKIPNKGRKRSQVSSFQSREAVRESSVRLIEHARRSKLEQQEMIFLRNKSNADNVDNDAFGESHVNAFAGTSFSDMSEKDFNKLVKKILKGVNHSK